MVSNSSEADDVASDSPASTISDETQSLWLGALLLTGGFLANTVQGALGKTAQETLSPGQFLWLLFVVALGGLLSVALWRKPDAFQVGWNAQIMPFYLLRAVFGLCGFYLFVWAAGLGSLVDATVLLNTTPVFIPVIGVVVLRQQIDLKLWGAIAIGFVGLLLVVQPGTALLHEPANLLGLGAGFSAAVEFLTVRWLSKTQPPLTQTLYYLVIGSVLMAPVALWEWQSLTLSTVAIIVAAACAFLSFQLLLVRAYSYAEPHQIGAFQYTSVVFAAAIGWFFFSEVPNTIALLGMLLICVGGAFSVYFERSPDPMDAPKTVES
ncbi:MAG: DMT family transporter [Cyanobacteria bacterium P01_F01_bin.3]